MFEAVLKPTSDLNALAQSLAVVAGMHNVSFSNLVYEILRALLVSVSQKHGLETLKVDAFIMIKLPLLLQKLHNFFRGSDGPPPPLKTPTDTYKAFDKLLKNENFLDAKDSLSKCNVLHILLMVVGKNSGAGFRRRLPDQNIRKKPSQVWHAGTLWFSPFTWNKMRPSST